MRSMIKLFFKNLPTVRYVFFFTNAFSRLFTSRLILLLGTISLLRSNIFNVRRERFCVTVGF